MNQLRDLLSRPLSGGEIVLVFLALGLLVALLVLWDLLSAERRAYRKAKRFLARHPQSAALYLYAGDPARSSARVFAVRGQASPAFRSLRAPFPGVPDGWLCYLAPGLVDLRVEYRWGIGPLGLGGRPLREGFLLQPEPGAVYGAAFDAASGRSRLVVWKGSPLEKRNAGSSASASSSKSSSSESASPGKSGGRSIKPLLWDNPRQLSIPAQFYRKELSRLLKLTGFLLLPILYLVLAAGLSRWLLLLPPGLLLLTLLSMATLGTGRARRVLHSLPPRRQEQVQADFLRPHLVCKLFLGEVHLLPDSLVIRSGGRLSLVLLEEVESARSFQPSGARGLSRNLVLKLSSGRTVHLEFFVGHQWELEAAAAWLARQNPRIFLEL